MTEQPYTSGSISEPYRALFEQLVAAFPQFEIWERHENYRRWLSVGVVNRQKGSSVTVPIVRKGISRTELFRAEELDRIRSHLASSSPTDLTL